MQLSDLHEGDHVTVTHMSHLGSFHGIYRGVTGYMARFTTKDEPELHVSVASIKSIEPYDGDPLSPWPTPEEWVANWVDTDRVYVVVINGPGKPSVVSRRMPGDQPFTGPWGCLTEEEADQLATAFNDSDSHDPREIATVAEVYRWEDDPTWPDSHS